MTCSKGHQNHFWTNTQITGGYIAALNFKLETRTGRGRPGFTLDLFNDGYNPTGTIKAIIRATDYIRITDTVSGESYYILDRDGNRFKPKYDTWYSLKYSSEIGKLTLKIWETDADEADAYEVVYETDSINAEYLNSPRGLRVSTAKIDSTGETYSVYFDDLRIWQDTAPRRGVDYWTETDKAEIVNAVLAALA